MTATEESSQTQNTNALSSNYVSATHNEDEPIDPAILKAICEEVKKVYDIVSGLVIGGGNISRGLVAPR